MRILLFAVLLIFQQGNGGDPNLPGGEQEPYHEGTAMHCDNYRSTQATHRCECERAMQKCNGLPEPPANIYMSRKCKTSCHPERCSCAGMHCRS